MDLEQFRALPLLGILRGITAEMVAPIASIATATGLAAIEVTMNTHDACSLIKQFAEAPGNLFSVGAGTVLSMKQLEEALSAGASFIVCPNTNTEIIRFCADNAIPVFPGALTPTEIFEAWDAGATMVKLFPSSSFGPRYIKDVKGPFDSIELLACGGVSPENIGEYFRNGASAIAFGSSIFDIQELASHNYPKIEQSLRALIGAFRNAGK